MATTHAKRDRCSVSNYDEIRCKHIVANFALDFKAQGLKGRVDLSMDAVSQASQIVLDTSFLQIHNVTRDGKSLHWTLEDRQEPYGSPLKIQLDNALNIGEKITVSVGKFALCLPLLTTTGRCGDHE